MVLGLSEEGNRKGRIESSLKEFVSKGRRKMSIRGGVWRSR